MRGLLAKDISLLFQRKQTYIIMLFIVVLMFLSADKDNSFIIGYVTFVSVIFSTSTISYDEHDNGYLFLMSLPVNAKMYVLEKYMFASISTVITCTAGIGLSWILVLARQASIDFIASLMGAVLMLSVALIIISTIIFFYIKFGSTKGGMVMAMFSGVFFAMIMAIGKAGASVPMFVKKIGQQPDWLVVIGVFSVGIILMAVSALASIHVMEKKEF